eukprot:3206797-Prymnesium_polylepis.1
MPAYGLGLATVSGVRYLKATHKSGVLVSGRHLDDEESPLQGHPGPRTGGTAPGPTYHGTGDVPS